ncbi:MAG: hypothetical protein ACRDLZ_03790 [Gaiellaceae bacterium]
MQGNRRWKLVALLATGMLVGIVMVGTPAGAHVSGWAHNWNQHIKPKADARYVKQTGALPAGKTLRGVYSAWGNGSGYIGDAVTYRSPLPADLDSAHVVFIPSGGATTPTCPGGGQAAAGYLCVYERGSGGATLGQIYRSANPGGGEGSSMSGFGIYFDTANAGGNWSYGQWVVRAAGSAAPRVVAPRITSTTPSGE